MPTANRISLELSACPRALLAQRGRLSRVLLAMAITCLGCASLAHGLQFQAAAGLQEREAATHNLAAARKEVLDAQAEAKRTRLALDEFLASHLAAQREASGARAESEADGQQPAALGSDLQAQIAELQAKRVTLLETLTEEHPEVIEVTSRIEAIEGRLKTSDAADVPREADSKATGPTLDAAEYQRLLRDWRMAERRLESARLAEAAAADRLNAVTNLLLHSPSAPIKGEEAALPAAAPPIASQSEVESPARANSGAEAEVVDPKASRTQTLALASLALAVMLAALAAVRLARATADPLFASADEVSAALAVPVVGIVPFGAKSASTSDAGMRRGLAMLGQIVLAIAVFSAIAYATVHFDGVLRLFRDPVGTLRTWFSL